jgi:hypothetical protein
MTFHKNLAEEKEEKNLSHKKVGISRPKGQIAAKKKSISILTTRPLSCEFRAMVQ